MHQAINQKGPGGLVILIFEVVLHCTSPVDQKSILIFNARFSSELQKLKRICIGSIYIPPRSKYKQETIDQIIQVIHFTRAKYDNEVAFTLAGDFNRTDYTDILESYGALQQCVEGGTRQASTDNATLTIILSYTLPSSFN